MSKKRTSEDVILTIRDVVEGDRNFIINSWLNSFKHSPTISGVHVDEAGNLVTTQVANLIGGKIYSKGGVKNSRRLAMGCTTTVYFYEQRRIIEALIDPSSGCHVDVLCSGENPDIIIGWLCSSVHDGVPIVHYLYVKKDFKNSGYAKRLLSNRNIDKSTYTFYTHLPPFVFVEGTGMAMSNWKETWLDRSAWVYDPWIISWDLARVGEE